MPGSRERLLTAAVEAFAAKGFHATTTRDIALAAGMSPAAIYVHHRSKEDLLHVISVNGHRGLLSAVTHAVEQAATPSDQLAALVQTWVSLTARNQAVSRVVADELDVLTPEHRAEVVQIRRELEATVRRVVDAGVAAGEFVTDAPPLTTRAIISLGMDVARWYRPEGAWSVEQIADHFSAAALRLVRP
ncbi:MAG: TetR/AcrR family transcriptional regulator [Mobilicoccus sp.]|nr:TetR/AcrR family transcriptional regulator [Mobilicoccus sp.]